MAISAERGQLERFLETVRVEGAGVAGIDAIRHVLPDRVTYVPEIDFTFRCLRDYWANPIGPRTALAGYRDGFFPSSADAYDFDRYDVEDYVSDFARTHFGWKINGDAAIYLDDKGEFYDVFANRGLDEYLPTLFGRVVDGELVGTDESLATLIRDQGRLVVKGVEGGSGNHVHVCRAKRGSVYVDGIQVRDDRLGDVFDEQEYLVTEFCQSGSYVRSIYPDAVSTVRAITMHPDEEEPFVAHLTHKIGTERTAPADTFGAGGISVHVDRSGRFGTGVRLEEGRLVPCTEHPDTGEVIPGTTIPEWGVIRDTLLDIISELPELRYVGWDIVVTEEGELRILEGNTNPGVEVQFHEPLLAEPLARRFFAQCGFPPNASPLDRVAPVMNA